MAGSICRRPRTEALQHGSLRGGGVLAPFGKIVVKPGHIHSFDVDIDDRRFPSAVA
jgi:hypothetical protein